MTDDELKALVAENSLAIREMREGFERRHEEAERWQEEAERRHEDAERRQEEAERRHEDAERRQEEAERRHEEAERQLAEFRRWTQDFREESDRRWRSLHEEILVSRREMDRLGTALHREMGALKNAFGVYTESMFQPSLERILGERFGMTVITAPQKFKIDGVSYEIDMVGHAGDESDEVYLVEIKSRLREDGIEQIHGHLRRFPRAFPEHRNKKLFGILAAVTIPDDLRAQALKQGLYLATVKDDVFELSTPDDFVPRPYGLRGLNP